MRAHPSWRRASELSQVLDTSLLLRAYSAGLFPMAENRASTEVFWVEPKRRGIFPIESFRPSRSLAKELKRERFEVVTDRDFRAVMRACAESAPGREDSWINEMIVEAYGTLHDAGFAHSVECWQDGALAGGLYGVSIAGAFFGESMFTRRRDASKVALAHLVARLKVGGFTLLDTQFLTAHLASLGAVEIDRKAYMVRLADALDVVADFGALEAGALPTTTVSGPISGKRIVQLLTQTS